MKNKEITNEKLAQMVAKGFKDMGGRFEKVDGRFDKVEKKLSVLERGQEDLKLRLDQVAYRFELEALQKRVKKCELELGLAKS